MAAALVAVRHAQMRQDQSPKVEIEEKMPLEADVIKVAVFGRQAISPIGTTYVKRNVAITEDALYISKPDSQDVLDVIPLHEIKQVCLLGFAALLTAW